MAGLAAQSKGRVAIIAGSGSIPVFVAETLREQGTEPFVIAIEGEADPALQRFEHVTITTAQIGRLMSALNRIKPADVVLVGGVRGRPRLSSLRPDLATVHLLLRVVSKLRSGDDVLLRGVVDMIEEEGFRVRGVHELVPELLAPEGQIAGPQPARPDRDALTTAVAGALALGRLDAGQACVAIGQRIVALEAAEGTDAMLRRVAELRDEGRLPTQRGGVLVKLAKPGQELRADLPTIGPATVENAARAQLSGIAVHAGRALVAEFDETCAKAKDLGVFLVGVVPEAQDLERVGG